jgi:hypothetical protein
MSAACRQQVRLFEEKQRFVRPKKLAHADKGPLGFALALGTMPETTSSPDRFRNRESSRKRRQRRSLFAGEVPA